MLFEQTLHGYDDGHRLLATSVRLEPEEEQQLDLLSDLSGYLPPETDYANYYTGFPCGRFYVLACTWPDRMGKRSGTVFTHSLLLPRAACAELGDLGSIIPLFRDPSHSLGVKEYRSTIDTALRPTQEPWLAQQSRRLLAAAWFGQETRPLLWYDQSTASDAARILWSWIPPWLRSNHTFCTFTLGPRYLGKALFDWMAIARGAEGLFYPLRDRAVRCDALHLPPGLASLVEEPWVAEIVEGPASWVPSLWREARELGFRELPARELRVFLRYREFRQRSQSNFTASLSRMDLLQRLAPSPNEAVDEKCASLMRALGHMRHVPPAERSVGALLQLLDRDPASFAAALIPDTGGLLAETLEHRFGKEDPSELERIWEAARKTGFSEPVRSGLLAGLRWACEAQLPALDLSRITRLLSRLIEEGPDVTDELLRSMPIEVRAQFLAALLQQISDETRTHVATGLLASLARIGEFSALPTLLGVVPLSEIMAVLVRDSDVPPTIVQSIVAMLLSDPAKAQAVLGPHLGSEGGIRILAAYASRSAAFTVESLLRANPTAASSIWRVAEESPSIEGMASVIEAGLSVVDANALIGIMEPKRAEQWQHAAWAPSVTEAICSSLIDRWLSSDHDWQRLRHWLQTSQVQGWIRWQGASAWRSKLLYARQGSALRAIELLTEPTTGPLRHNEYLLESCVESWARLPVRDICPMVPAWIRLLEGIGDERIRTRLSALTLNVVLREGDAELAPLAEVTFATAHRELLAQARHGWFVRNVFGWFLAEDNWDRAAQLREKLAKTWVKEDWPPLSLLRAVQGDGNLFDDLVARARQREGGKRALRRLWRAAQEVQEPDQGWRYLLERLPRSVREDVD